MGINKSRSPRLLTRVRMMPLISSTDMSAFLHSPCSQMIALTRSLAGWQACSQDSWFPETHRGIKGNAQNLRSIHYYYNVLPSPLVSIVATHVNYLLHRFAYNNYHSESDVVVLRQQQYAASP